MKVTTKGQVTIPLDVRQKLGLHPHSEVEFVEDKQGRFYVRKIKRTATSRFRKAAKLGQLKMTTEEILKLTREP